MSEQHTPAPWGWKWETEKRKWAIVTDSTGGIIANVNTETGPDALSAPATRKMPAEANVRLIAAAPEMLNALVNLLAPYGEQEIEEIPPLATARDLIVRIKGGAR